MTEPQPRLRPRDRRRLSAGRASRSTIRGSSPPARPARWRGSRTRMEPVHTRIPRRPLRRGVRPQGRRAVGVHASPMSCARCRPAATCCRRPSSRTCTVRIASAAPATGSDRGAKPHANASMTELRSRKRDVAAAMRRRRAEGRLRRSPRRCRGRSVSAGLCGFAALWVHLARARRRSAKLEFSTLVLDREGRLLRPYATADGRWRLPVTLADVDPRYRRSADRLRGQALPRASRRRSARARPRRVAAR